MGSWGQWASPVAAALGEGTAPSGAWLGTVAWAVALAAVASWGWRRLLALVWVLGRDPGRRLVWSVPLVRGALVVLVVAAAARAAWFGGGGALGSLSLAVVVGVFALRQGQDAVAGLLLAFRRPFRLGDEIGVGDVVGRVEEIGLTVVRVRGAGGVGVELPTRALTAQALRRPGPGRRALPVAVEVPLPGAWPPIEALERLRDHALCSPYVDVSGPITLEVLGGGRARCVAVPAQPDDADALRGDLVARAEELAASAAPPGR